MDVIKFFITWGPTFLFVLIVLIGILIGWLRGFRKSLILFIHMLAAGVISLVVYLCMINNPNLDASMVGMINSIVKIFTGETLQEIMHVSENCETLHQMLTEMLIGDATDEDLIYWMITDNAAYIATLVDLAYHLVFAVLCFILYFFIVFILYLIYLVAYPIRRKIKKENVRFQKGEVKHPYKRKRLLGGIIGGVRSIITGVIMFSFLGGLIFVVTGGANLPQRDEYKEDETIEFTNNTFNEAYDYYSYVCAMGNTGIFQVLNAVKDPNDTPFYFYFADLVFQGRLDDDNLGIYNEKLYLREEIGEVVHLVNNMLALFMKYGNPQEVERMMSSNDMTDEEKTLLIEQIFGNPEFANEFSAIIDDFEGNGFVTKLCLSSLTSLINHIDLVVDDEGVIGLVNQLFKSEDAIAVTDLATEADIKGVFKSLINIVCELSSEPEAFSEDVSEEDEQTIRQTKKLIHIAQQFLPTIQNLSIFQERKTVGNKVINGLYKYCCTDLVEGELDIQVPEDIDWVAEFQILLSACGSLLSIAYEIYDLNTNAMISNMVHMFDGESVTVVEQAFDTLTEQLLSSKLLDVVFKSSSFGDTIDQLIVGIASGDQNARIPKNIDYVGKDGECSILLKSFKLFLKNGGGDALLTMLDNSEGKEEATNSANIVNLITTLSKEITVEEEQTTLIEILLESKLLYYTISTYLKYANFGNFKIYLPKDAVEVIEGCQVIKFEEIHNIVDILTNCVDLIVNLIDDPQNIDYATILSDSYIQEKLKDENSLLLQGTLANVIIGISEQQEIIVLPKSFDSAETWLSYNNEDGEIILLIDAVFEITKKDPSLINELMNGSIQPAVLLNLDKSVLEQLCASKVLRYTISDMVTDLGDQGFQIVVAYASLEEIDAETTTEKTVNVIQANELSDIFADVQMIISFDENEDIKIDYNSIFENKATLSENKTITATIIQAMFDNNGEEFLVIPDNYKTDFEKIKTQSNLTGNVWFGTSEATTDDELYLMLAAVETLIDKDEDGKIPDEFDFSTIQDNLKLKEDSVDTFCASAILNASISTQITKMFYVPVAYYQEQIITQNELDLFFKAIFKMFDKTEIVVNELNNDLFDIMFRRDATPVILDSTILRATISHKMSTVNQLAVPLSIAKEVSFVSREDGYNLEKEELSHLFDAMFEVFGTDTIMVNDIEKQLNAIEIKKSSIAILTQSLILRSTISKELSSNDQLIILLKDVLAEELIDATQLYVIEKEELESLLNSVFLIVQKDNIVLNQINEQFTNITLSKQDVPKLLESSVLRATFSKKIIENDELVIPANYAESLETIGSNYLPVITQLELQNVLDAMYVVFDCETLAMEQLNESLQSFNLTKDMIDSLLNSFILKATLSKNFIESGALTIPSNVLVSIQTITNETEDIITRLELGAFFEGIFTTTDEINGKEFELTQIQLPTELAQAQAMTNSLIISATLSTEAKTEGTIIRIIDEMIHPYILDERQSDDSYIDQEELARLLLAMTVGLGKTNPTNLALDDIFVPETTAQKEAIVNSVIMRTTITEKVLNQVSVGIRCDSTAIDKTKHINHEEVAILTSEEILVLIRGIELLNSDHASFDHLVIDVKLILQMENKIEVLKTISDSEVYRSIMSTTLGEEHNIYGHTDSAYQMFITDMPTALVSNELYTYKNSSYVLGKYVIQYPSQKTEVFRSFTLEKGQMYLCDKIDIMALQYTLGI